MKINEILHESTIVQEIERLSRLDYTGGKEYLHDKTSGKTIKKLPGGSGLYYSIGPGRWGEGYDIKIWDPKGKEYLALKQMPGDPEPVKKRGESMFNFKNRYSTWQINQRALSSPGQLVGKLVVSPKYDFPLRGAVQVETITIDEDYRGMSLAKALYGIVLAIMKRPLVAGDSQTPGGRRNWVSLANIPGVQIKGYVPLEDWDLDTSQRISTPIRAKQAEKNIDTIMGKLGGQYIGSRDGTEFFAFNVKPNSTGNELEAHVNTNLSKIYGYRLDFEVGLYAVWTG